MEHISADEPLPMGDVGSRLASLELELANTKMQLSSTASKLDQAHTAVETLSKEVEQIRAERQAVTDAEASRLRELQQLAERLAALESRRDGEKGGVQTKQRLEGLEKAVAELSRKTEVRRAVAATRPSNLENEVPASTSTSSTTAAAQTSSRPATARASVSASYDGLSRGTIASGNKAAVKRPVSARGARPPSAAVPGPSRKVAWGAETEAPTDTTKPDARKKSRTEAGPKSATELEAPTDSTKPDVKKKTKTEVSAGPVVASTTTETKEETKPAETKPAVTASPAKTPRPTASPKAAAVAGSVKKNKAAEIAAEESPREQMDRLLGVLGDSEENWATRCTAVKTALALVKDDTLVAERASILSSLAEPVAQQLVDQRSTMVKEVCAAVSSLADSLGPQLEPFGIPFLPHVFRLSYVTVKVISNSACDCIIKLLSTLRPEAILPLITTAAADVHPGLRTVVATALPLVMAKASEGMAEQLGALLKTQLEDSAAQVRAEACGAWTALATRWPEMSQGLARDLAPATKKLIARKGGSISISPPPTRPRLNVQELRRTARSSRMAKTQPEVAPVSGPERPQPTASPAAISGGRVEALGAEEVTNVSVDSMEAGEMPTKDTAPLLRSASKDGGKAAETPKRRALVALNSTPNRTVADLPR